MRFENKIITGETRYGTGLAYNPGYQIGRMDRVHFSRGQRIERTTWKTMYAVRLENTDVRAYNNELYGFSHRTNSTSLRNILQSGQIFSSYNLREQQRTEERHLTGGDRGHDGQHAVYFRFVEKKDALIRAINSLICLLELSAPWAAWALLAASSFSSRSHRRQTIVFLWRAP